ncbi:Dentin sialophosphoprotein-like protein [Hirschfeldia incana]|nr:Dentin sialophosphoprotein-like protein [Hirschfeldia incana]KAJ0251000.1 Dentin sialophosphoprotein-like protein [Hirschfeldia incana]
MDCNESMASTGSLELKSTINNDLPWKMVAKGSRSSTRRTKKQVARSAAPDVEADYKSATEGDTGSAKLGVSVLGRHLAERVDHVPIKKRRFMVPAPSALNVRSQHRAEVNHALPVSRLNPNLMGGKTPKVCDDDKPVCGHDFSGIEILAEVACSSGMSSEIASVVDSQVVEPVRQQDALTLSGHVEGNDSSTGTVDVSRKDTKIESGEKSGKDKSEVIAPQNASAADQSEEHMMGASSSMIVAQNISVAVSNESSTERPKEDIEAGDSGNLAPKNVTVSENISGEECTGKGKNSESLTNDRLHWDLNLPTDAWGQSCDVVDETSRRYSDGEVTESVTERTHVDGSKNYATTGLIASDVHMNSPLSPGHKAEASTQNGKEFQSGYDSQFEDGELREPYPWEENEGDSGDVEQVDYGSEPENERFYSLAECNENKQEDVEKGVVAQTKCGAAKCESGNVHEENNDVEKHVVVCTNDSHSKGSSPSRSFGSKPFREPPSHEPIRSRRPYSHEDMSERDAGPNKFVGRERTEMRMQNRSPRRGQFSRWDSEHRFSPSVYKRGQYGFERPPPKAVEEGRVRMSGFDQPGPDPGPQGYVRRHFSNGGYRGRFRRFPDGNGNRDFRGVDCSYPPSDANDYPSRMHNSRINSRRERSNSPPVFRRLHDPQSRSRPRSRSPVSWNGQNRSPPGFRADDNRMERVRLPFQKRFPVDQEMGFMSPQRNQRNSRFFDSRNNDGGGENHYNNFRGRKSPPGRMFRQEQRFDNMRRVNSENNNNFRPFVRHGNNNRRFDDGGGGSRGEGCRYEKNENMYEMVHRRPPPPRGLETVEEDDGGNIRRFRLEAEQLDTVVSSDNKKNNNEASSLTNKT